MEHTTQFTIQTPKGSRTIGEGSPTFIIAEMSANHEQDFAKAKKIIDVAADAGADAIKLQTYTADTITLNCDNEHFIINNTENPDFWHKKTLHSLYQEAYTPWEWHKELQEYAHQKGLVLFSTPFDETAVDFLETLDVPLYKIASYEATHIPLIKKVAQTGKPVIISVGFATQDEVDLAVQTLKENNSGPIILLHCVTAYAREPKLEDSNLVTMLHMKQRYGVLTGFSDNNGGIEIPLQAVLMGASVVEKHIVADEKSNSFDADFSVGPQEFTTMVQAIRRAEKISGTVRFGPQSEKEQKNTKYRRSIFVAEPIKEGEVFTHKNIRVVRPSVGLEPKYYEEIIGKQATQHLEKGTPLTWEMVQR